MLKSLAILVLLPVPCVAAGAAFPSNHDLGKVEGACRKDDPEPELLVSVLGLKDHQGTLKLEVYPANDEDFLQDDKILVREGKTFRRVETAVPPAVAPELCIRLPSPGRYAVSLLHDRDSNRKFTLATDGVGFAGNPRIHWSRPAAAESSVAVGLGLTRIQILLNYRHGLFAFGPVRHR